MNGTEVAIKSEHLKQIKGEIEKLESEKCKIQDWVKAKEKQADEAEAKKVAAFDEISNKSREIESREKAIKVKESEIKSKLAGAESLSKDADNKAARVAADESRISEMYKNLKDQDLALGEREAKVKKQESFIHAFFEGVEKLK